MDDGAVGDSEGAPATTAGQFTLRRFRCRVNGTSMITDLEILRCAALLLKERTVENALLYAAGRAEEERKKGDALGHAVWLQIIDAINEMIRTERSNDEPLQ